MLRKYCFQFIIELTIAPEESFKGKQVVLWKTWKSQIVEAWILIWQLRERASKVHEACGDIETARIRAS